MTAKTTLVQLHHKIKTFEHINKHLVLVIQDHFLDYMKTQFSFDHLNAASIGDPMHLHAYHLQPHCNALRLELSERLSTDVNGISFCLGLQANANVELVEIVRKLETKISNETILHL